MSYVYANRAYDKLHVLCICRRAYDQFVNAHVWVYDRRASPFSISIMHAHLKKKKNQPCTMYMPGRLQSAKNILVMPRPGGLQLWKVLLWVDTRPSGIVESRYPPNTGYEYGLCGQGAVVTNRMGESACVVAQAFFKAVSVACKDRLWW